MKKIEIKLTKLLKERDMSQAQLAELAEVRPNAISNLCRGYVDRLSIKHLEQIGEALQLNSISELLEFIEVEKSEE